MLWHAAVSLDALNALTQNTLIRHLGIVFTDIGEDYVKATMPVDARTHQPHGLLHGGASVVLAETLGSTAAGLCLNPAEALCVGQEINANHLRAVRGGLVTGTARAVHIGGRSHVWSIDIVNAAGELVCISRITLAVIRKGALATR